jgi:hypothetical protein
VMSHGSGTRDGVRAVARLLAGAPATDIEESTSPEPWAGLIEAVVQASGGDRLAVFEDFLAKLPDDQAARIRSQVGRVGRSILQGRADDIPTSLPEMTGSVIPDLPQAALLPPELEARMVDAGQWLDAYVSFACDVSPLTPPELHQSAGLWLGSVAIARRVRLRLRHDDLFPNLLVLWICDTTIYAKTTGLNIAKRFARSVFPHLLAVSEFSPEALLDDFAGRQPLGLQDLPEEDRSMWTERRNFAAQRGIVLDEAASLFSSFKRDYNAGLPYYLLRLSDCDPEVEKLTRGAGKVVAHNTYLSFLGSTTAAALMRTDLDFLWGSGLWPRFALLTPSELPPWRSPKPGHCDPPQALTRTLQRLAEEKLPEPVYPAAPQTCDVQLEDGVHAAWRAYARAMIRDLLTSPEAPDKRLWGVYGRLPSQAFKVAVILATLDWAEGDGAPVPIVSLAHWARGQTIAESWRASAHRLLDSLSNRRVVEEHNKEDRILQMILAARTGGITARSIYRTLGLRRAEFDLAVAGLVRDGLIREVEIKPARGPSACGYVSTENLSRQTTGLTG